MSKVSLRLILAVVVLAATPALANHDWGGYHWKSNNGVSLNVADLVSSAWDAYLDGAIVDWNSSNVLALTEVAGSGNPRTCKGTTGRIDVCSAAYGNNGWLGLASIWASGGHITKATTKLNDSYFGSGSTYNTPAYRRFVTCQEVGHDFGLAHQDETFNNANLGSCMDYTNDPDGGAGGAVSNDPSNEHPNSHDYQLLTDKYSHTDSAAAAAAAFPAAADALDLNHPAAWGRLIQHSRDHAIEVYELDFGNGKKVITHVLWTNEAAAQRRAEHQHHD
jgi:hypothetical protein